MILKLKVGREFEAEFCSKILKLISDQYFCKMYDLKEVSFWLRCAFCNLSLYLPVKYLSREIYFFCKCSYSSYFVSLLHSHLLIFYSYFSYKTRSCLQNNFVLMIRYPSISFIWIIVLPTSLWKLVPWLESKIQFTQVPSMFVKLN